MNKRDQRKASKARHIQALETLGFKASQFNRLRAIENKAHWHAERYANGDIDTDGYAVKQAEACDAIKALLGKMPQGFFVNSDPRGFALKIELKTQTYDYADFYTDDELRGLQKDWGGYVIIAPDPDNF